MLMVMTCPLAKKEGHRYCCQVPVARRRESSGTGRTRHSHVTPLGAEFMIHSEYSLPWRRLATGFLLDSRDTRIRHEGIYPTMDNNAVTKGRDREARTSASAEQPLTKIPGTTPNERPRKFRTKFRDTNRVICGRMKVTHCFPPLPGNRSHRKRLKCLRYHV